MKNDPELKKFGDGQKPKYFQRYKKSLRVIVRENQAKMEIFGMCDVTEFNEIWG